MGSVCRGCCVGTGSVLDIAFERCESRVQFVAQSDGCGFGLGMLDSLPIVRGDGGASSLGDQGFSFGSLAWGVCEL